MASILKHIRWDISSRLTRHQYIAFCIKDIPGSFGIAVRRAWYVRRFKTCGKNLEVCSGTIILNPQNIECGDDVSIGACSYIQAGGGIAFESDVLLGPYVKIWSQNHNYNDYQKPVRKQGYTYKSVRLGNDVWAGANVFIMPGTVIGAKSIIAGSSVVLGREYPEGSILAGYPARKIGDRKTEYLNRMTIYERYV